MYSLWKSLFQVAVFVFRSTLFSPNMCIGSGLYAVSPQIPTSSSPVLPQAPLVRFFSVTKSLYAVSTGLVISSTTKLLKGFYLLAGWENQATKRILEKNEEEL